MFIIAQVNEKCNGEISKTGIAEVIQTLQDSGRINDLIAVEILKGSNEKALDILRVCGCKAVVPGTMFAPLAEVSRFYKCQPRYLHTVLNRVGITPTKTSTDVMKCSFSYFLEYFGIGEKFFISSRYNTHTLTDVNTKQKYEFTHTNSSGGNFYSARVVLALAVLMYYGRTANTDSVGGGIYEQLLESTYYDAAQQNIASSGAQKQTDSKTAIPDDNTAVMDDGKVTMTAEFLAGLIKTAVHEAVAEYAKVATPVVYSGAVNPPSASSHDYKRYAHGTVFNSASKPCRLAKPNNWDEVMTQYNAGAITQAAAAKMTGMCVSTFIKYSKGFSQFPS